MKLNFEQRQRVEDLATDDSEDLAWRVVTAEAQRDQLKEALEWYADERNHFPRIVHQWVMEKENRRFAPIYGDIGERARVALEQTGGKDET